MRKLALLLLLAVPLAAEPPADVWRALDRREGLPSDDVLDLCASGPDRLWVATAAGLCRVEEYDITTIRGDGVPHRVAAAPGGGAYALYDREIVRIGAGRELIPLPEDPGVHRPSRLASEPDGTLWVAVQERVYRRPPDGEWSLSRAPAGLFASEPGRADPGGVHKSIVFRGEVWGATRGRGLLRRRLQPRFRMVALPRARNVNALALGRDGSVWCGTESGLAHVVGERVESLASILGTAIGPVTAVACDRDGRVWVGSGSAFRGLFRFDGQRWERLDAIDGFVHRITVDPSGVLWFAMLHPAGEQPAAGRGAWYASGGELKPAPANVELPSARIYDVVARDPSGVLWFATLKGLAAYEGPDRVTHYTVENGGLRGEKVWCLCAARDGSLWIGYQQERGVSRLARGVITHFDVDDGLCDGNVWAIVEGRPGVFWFATQSGLSRYDGRRWSCFRVEDGLGSAAVWPLLPLQDGSLWIGTLGAGLVHLQPDDTRPPRTRLRRAHVAPEGHASISWTGTDAWFDTPVDKLWYRWRLDGGRWSEASPGTQLELDLDRSRHRLEIQALDRFGNAEERPLEIDLEVPGGARPSWPVLVLLTALLLALGWLTGRRAARRGS